jgi:enterochelin esterase-like enzyme
MKNIIAISIFCGTLLQAADLSGRWSGSSTYRTAEGNDVSNSLFLVLIQNGRELSGRAGPSADRLFPFESGTVEDNTAIWVQKIQLNGAIFRLTLNGSRLEGEMRPNATAKPLVVSMQRAGNLTTSDLVPQLPFEGDVRSPRLVELRKEMLDGKADVLSTFWRDMKTLGTPLIESMEGTNQTMLVTFLWRGSPETRNALVQTALANSFPDDYLMSNVPGTDLWFKTIRLPAITRTRYWITPNHPQGYRPASNDVKRPQKDPLSQHDSVLELPGAPPQPWFAHRENVGRLAVEKHSLKSTLLGNTRDIHIYVPPGYSKSAQPYPVLFLFDGEDPNGFVFSTDTIENLIEEGRIPPLVTVRIANPDQQTRNRELACGPKFADFLNGELVPFVRERFNVTHSAEKTIISGYSLGGLAAAWAGLKHPETFGLILSQSGSFFWEPTPNDEPEPNWLAKLYIASPKLPLRFYIDAGIFEVDLSTRSTGIMVPSHGAGGILLASRQMRDVLLAKGYEVTYREFGGAHENINWRGTLADGLIALIGTK